MKYSNFIKINLTAFVLITHAVEKPNFILMMADDLGWGELAYNGLNPHIKTPNLDEMSRNGIRFDRFYSASAVCSPTRASVMTGRNPTRQGIANANAGHMLPEEITIAEAVKTVGYTTGHFGKWHLGTLTTEIKDSNRGAPGVKSHFSPPWINGFDVCFSTEAKTPTYNPYGDVTDDTPFGTYGTSYWNEKGERMNGITENITGDDSKVIMDRVIPFIQNAVASQTPFLSVIWFHTPHKPISSSQEDMDLYPGLKGNAYYGCITALDRQVGRLRAELKTLGIADHTVVFFTSDNGPENGTPYYLGNFSGNKRSLHEGGIRVAGLMEWPEMVPEQRVTDFPAFTSDYYPTILDIIGIKIKEQTLPLDGISLLPFIEGKMTERDAPMVFKFSSQKALILGDYKLYKSNNSNWMLYNLANDVGEKNNVSDLEPDKHAELLAIMDEWDATSTVYKEGCCTPELTRDTVTHTISPKKVFTGSNQTVRQFTMQGKLLPKTSEAQNVIIRNRKKTLNRQ